MKSLSSLALTMFFWSHGEVVIAGFVVIAMIVVFGNEKNPVLQAFGIVVVAVGMMAYLLFYIFHSPIQRHELEFLFGIALLAVLVLIIILCCRRIAHDQRSESERDQRAPPAVEYNGKQIT